jgi:hypothetical protein
MLLLLPLRRPEAPEAAAAGGWRAKAARRRLAKTCAFGGSQPQTREEARMRMPQCLDTPSL